MDNLNELTEIEVETIEVPLEDGSDLECAILDEFEVDGKCYMLLAAMDGDVITDEEFFYNFEEDGEFVILNYIEDEAELEKVAKAYEALCAEDEAE